VSPKTDTLPDHIFDASGIGDFDKIHDKKYNAVMWRRTLSPELLAETRRPFSSFPHRRFDDDDRNWSMAQALSAYARGFKLPPPAAIINDLSALLAMFKRLSGKKTVGIRMERQNRKATQILHTDYVTLRMICTLRGKGSRWLANDDADHGCIGTSDALICRGKPGNIRTMEAGHVVLFKGQLYGTNGNRCEKLWVHGDVDCLDEDEWRWIVVFT
jgi:hypothetical protein